MCKSTAKMSLMVDIHSVRNSFHANKIFNVNFVQSGNNHADSFTKLIKLSSLHPIRTEDIANLPVRQCVYRIGNDSHDLKTGDC